MSPDKDVLRTLFNKKVRATRLAHERTGVGPLREFRCCHSSDSVKSVHARFSVEPPLPLAHTRTRSSCVQVFGGTIMNVWNSEWFAYSSTNSRNIGALFRIRNTQSSGTIGWRTTWYYTSYSGYVPTAEGGLLGWVL